METAACSEAHMQPAPSIPVPRRPSVLAAGLLAVLFVPAGLPADSRLLVSPGFQARDRLHSRRMTPSEDWPPCPTAAWRSTTG